MNLSAIRERVAVDTVRWAPKGLFSGLVGWGSRRRLPRPLRAPIYTAFARAVGAELSEVELPLPEYPSFGSFFARRLRPGARAIAPDAGAVIAPCDGEVAAAGTAEAGRLIQAKGHGYALADLLVDPALAESLEGGAYFTVYLSPRDYHRVHSPVAGALVGYDYVPGELFPVSRIFAERVSGLFVANERVVIRLDTEVGQVALVMVGATGVGNITLSRPEVEGRALRGRGGVRRIRLREPVEVARGQELGAFQLGSTVILVFEPGRIEPVELSPGEPLAFGQPIGQGRRQRAPQGVAT